jgi:hypothetical protein
MVAAASGGGVVAAASGSGLSQGNFVQATSAEINGFRTTLKTKSNGSIPKTGAYSGINMANIVDKGIKITDELSSPNKFKITENLFSDIGVGKLIFSANVYVKNEGSVADTVYGTFYYASSSSASISQSQQFGPIRSAVVSPGATEILTFYHYAEKGDPSFTVGKFIFIAIKSTSSTELIYTTDSTFVTMTDPARVFGADQSAITGIVKSAENQFIVGAQIIISSMDRRWPDKIVQSGSDGTFSFPNRQTIFGPIKLRILKTGFVTRELEIDTDEEAQDIIKDGVIEIIMTKN